MNQGNRIKMDPILVCTCPVLVMLNSFQHLLPKAILTQILEILKEILKQVQDDKAVQEDIALILMRLPCIMNTKHKLKGPIYQMPIIHLPVSIQKVFGDEGSKDFISVLNEIEDAQIHRTIEKIEDKFEKRLVIETTKLDQRLSKLDSRLTEEVAKLDRRITEEVAKLDHRITEEVAKLDHRITEEVAKLDHRIGSLEIRLTEKILETKNDIFKWMITMWLTQMLAIIGLIVTVLFK